MGVGRKVSTPTREVVSCTCGRKRELAAKDKKDWVQCNRCKCWSHLSCYQIGQNIIAKEDVQFYFFFCVMERMAGEEEDTVLQRGR